MSAARKVWRVEGLDHFTHTWDHVLDCHANSKKKALANGWYYLVMFVPFEKRLHIISLRARRLNEDPSNSSNQQEKGTLEFINTSEDPEPW